MKIISKLLAVILSVNLISLNYSYAVEDIDKNIASNEENMIDDIIKNNDIDDLEEKSKDPSSQNENEENTSIDDSLKNQTAELDKEISREQDTQDKSKDDLVMELKSKIMIDELKSIIENKDIYVRGWSLNASGVKEVKVYIDGALKTNAEIGLSRPDVDSAYPGYTGGLTSGYEAMVDINNVSSGDHKLKIVSTGNDESSISIEKSITVKKPGSKINIDELKTTIENKNIYVRGWSLNASGVKEVKVYIDGALKTNAEIGLSRPDVNSAYPGYTGGLTSGYEVMIDINNVSSGDHKLKIVSTGNDGSSISIEKSITVKKHGSKVNIDELKTTIENKDIYVRGWSLNASGVKEVKVYIDGKLKTNATIGLKRPDVNKEYPGYPDGSNSGYEGTIDVNDISAGEHKLKVESIGKDGSSISTEKSITVKKPSSKVNIDEPKTTIENKDIYVRGWSLNASGVKEVRVYIDGKLKTNTMIGLERPDVNSAYPGYPGGSNSGYEGTIDINDISAGEHKLKVESIGKDGSSISIEKSITVKKPGSKINIDEPKTTIENKDIYVRGWSLNASGVKEVRVYIDGDYKGNANTGLKRFDVGSVYPEYPNASTSGYDYTIPKDKISPGKHTLKVESIGNDGSKEYSEIQINMVKHKPMINIELPREETIQIKDITNIDVKGWALNASGVKDVKIYLNTRLVAQTKADISRPDVNSAYPGYPGGENSGFKTKISTTGLIPGQYKMIVIVAGNDGSSYSIEKTYKITNGLIVIDPGHGGKDSGAVAGNYVERDMNLEISNAAVKLLRANGYDVIMTRTTNNKTVELAERSSMSNSLNVDLYVSIHNDSGGGNGAHSIYSVKDKSDGPSKTLAQNILNSISRNTSQNIASKGAWTRTLDDGRDYYHVIRNVKATSVIVECAFLDSSDVSAVNTYEKRNQMGQAIAKGIIDTVK